MLWTPALTVHEMADTSRPEHSSPCKRYAIVQIRQDILTCAKSWRLASLIYHYHRFTAYRTTCISRQPQLRTGGFSWTRNLIAQMPLLTANSALGLGRRHLSSHLCRTWNQTQKKQGKVLETKKQHSSEDMIQAMVRGVSPEEGTEYMYLCK